LLVVYVFQYIWHCSYWEIRLREKTSIDTLGGVELNLKLWVGHMFTDNRSPVLPPTKTTNCINQKIKHNMEYFNDSNKLNNLLSGGKSALIVISHIAD